MRNRNIKLNVFLNEREHDLLIEKTNKVRLTQSEFIRKLIKDYNYETKSKIDIDTINNIVKSSIKDLNEVNNYMHRLRYEKIIVVLDKVINNLNKLIDDKSNAK